MIRSGRVRNYCNGTRFTVNLNTSGQPGVMHSVGSLTKVVGDGGTLAAAGDRVGNWLPSSSTHVVAIAGLK